MSARLLTDGHMARNVRSTREPEPTDPKKLSKDQMRLYGFYKPSLLAGDYAITASQTVTSSSPPLLSMQRTQSIVITNTRHSDTSNSQAEQEFEVVVPRFSLDSDLINSYYPPDGHEDEGRILPHIVLNDPHYPWEIAAGQTTNLHGEINDDNKRSIVPWVALLVFDPSELNLPSLADAQNLVIPGFTTDTDMKAQSANGTFSMKVNEYFGTIAQSARVNFDLAYSNDPTGLKEITQSTEKVNVIFPKKELVKALFTSSIATDTGMHKHGLEQLKYLAHVRHINTEGCPDAGVEQEGLFSVVISGRTGALRDRVFANNMWTDLSSNLTEPRTQVVHLVSIENLDKTFDIWGDDPPSGTSRPQKRTDRIGLFSLFSWVYRVIPPDPSNFVTTMKNLVENQQMLRVEDKIWKQLEDASTSVDTSIKTGVSKALARRLKMGYTLARWRPETGEETTAWNRGPLVPINVPNPLPDNAVPDCSATSKEYQIIDPETGLADLSYSSAWQLGKLLATSDTTFSAALARFRSVVRNAASDQTRMELNNMTTGSQLQRDTKAAIKAIWQKSAGQTGDPVRINTNDNRNQLADLTNIKSLPAFMNRLQAVIAASTSVVKSGNTADLEPYNGFNKVGPNNNDWPIIHNWLVEKLSLGGIPPQYIVPEPSFVPLESIRFFLIDDFWLDCMVDGALSIANHLDNDDDVVRREIKRHFNVYLDSLVTDAHIKPQIPTSGFFIRSKVIKTMPDLRITVEWKVKDARYPVCRWTRVDDSTLLCLLDRRLEELNFIEFAQPQHQQRYALGSEIDASEKSKVTFLLRKVVEQDPGIYEDAKPLDPSMSTAWLDFPHRRMNTQLLAKNINEQLRAFSPATTTPNYTDTVANSCEVGIELNDPAYFFQIKPPELTEELRDRSGHSIEGGTIKADFSNFRNRQIYIKAPKQPTPPSDGGKNTDSSKGKAGSVTLPSSTVLMNPLPAIPAPTSQNRLQPFDATKLPLQVHLGPDNPTNQSRFRLAIYADYKGFPQDYQDFPSGPQKSLTFDTDNFIPTKNINYFDLIFSLRRMRVSDAKLSKITIDIPMQVTDPARRDNTQSFPKAALNDPTKDPEPLVSANYTGPGVRMLSNQRFIPFLYTGTFVVAGGKDSPVIPTMHIELIPRSANFDYSISMGGQDATDSRTLDLSFRLAQPRIVPCAKPQVQVKLTSKDNAKGQAAFNNISRVYYTEYYKDNRDVEVAAASKWYDVRKLDMTDPKEPK